MAHGQWHMAKTITAEIAEDAEKEMGLSRS